MAMCSGVLIAAKERGAAAPHVQLLLVKVIHAHAGTYFAIHTLLTASFV
jgi:hypothetical protein